MRALHHWTLCPLGRTVRAVLGEKGQAFEDRPETPWSPSAELMKADPSGAGPVLTFGGEPVAVGARAAVEYLEETAPEPGLFPGEPAERAEIRRLIDWFERGLEIEAAAPIRMEKVIKRITGDGPPDMDVVRAAREAMRWRLDYADYLAEQRDWLAGRRLSAADIAAAAHLSSLDYLGEVPWGDYPAAKEWYAKIKSRPCFRPILADRIPGCAPPAHYQDLDF